eukprot:4318039-Amphidinium_carterae.1
MSSRCYPAYYRFQCPGGHHSEEPFGKTIGLHFNCRAKLIDKIGHKLCHHGWDTFSDQCLVHANGTLEPHIVHLLHAGLGGRHAVKCGCEHLVPQQPQPSSMDFGMASRAPETELLSEASRRHADQGAVP